MSGEAIVALIAAAMSLVLVGTGLRGRGLSLDKSLAMILAWAAIIGGLAIIAAWFGA